MKRLPLPHTVVGDDRSDYRLDVEAGTWSGKPLKIILVSLPLSEKKRLGPQPPKKRDQDVVRTLQ